MKNSDIEILIKEHEIGIGILKDMKSLNEDIEIYTYCLNSIKGNSDHSLRAKLDLKINELIDQKIKLINKYKLI